MSLPVYTVGDPNGPFGEQVRAMYTHISTGNRQGLVPTFEEAKTEVDTWANRWIMWSETGMTDVRLTRLSFEEHQGLASAAASIAYRVWTLEGFEDACLKAIGARPALQLVNLQDRRAREVCQATHDHEMDLLELSTVDWSGWTRGVITGLLKGIVNGRATSARATSRQHRATGRPSVALVRDSYERIAAATQALTWRDPATSMEHLRSVVDHHSDQNVLQEDTDPRYAFAISQTLNYIEDRDDIRRISQLVSRYYPVYDTVVALYRRDDAESARIRHEHVSDVAGSIAYLAISDMPQQPEWLNARPLETVSNIVDTSTCGGYGASRFRYLLGLVSAYCSMQ